MGSQDSVVFRIASSAPIKGTGGTRPNSTEAAREEFLRTGGDPPADIESWEGRRCLALGYSVFKGIAVVPFIAPSQLAHTVFLVLALQKSRTLF